MSDQPFVNKGTPTSMLIVALKESSDPQVALQTISKGFTLPTLPSHLNTLMGRYDLTTKTLFDCIRLERSTGYKIMNGQRQPSRNVLLRIALALSLDLDQTQYLLKVGRRSALSPRNRRDALIIYCLAHVMSLDDAEAILASSGEDDLSVRL